MSFGPKFWIFVGTTILALILLPKFTLTTANILVGLALGAVMTLGSFVGKKLLDRLPERIFIFLIETTLLIAGLGFLIGG